MLPLHGESTGWGPSLGGRGSDVVMVIRMKRRVRVISFAMLIDFVLWVW